MVREYTAALRDKAVECAEWQERFVHTLSEVDSLEVSIHRQINMQSPPRQKKDLNEWPELYPGRERLYPPVWDLWRPRGLHDVTSLEAGLSRLTGTAARRTGCEHWGSSMTARSCGSSSAPTWRGRWGDVLRWQRCPSWRFCSAEPCGSALQRPGDLADTAPNPYRPVDRTVPCRCQCPGRASGQVSRL